MMSSTTLLASKTASSTCGGAFRKSQAPRVSLPARVCGRSAPRRRQPCSQPAQAFLALDAFLAPPPVLLQPPHEVAVAFVTVAPIVSAPQCLCHLAMEDLVQPAPPLVGEAGRPALHHMLLTRQDSIKMEAAVCLLQPVVLEENAAEIVWESADEQAAGQQMQLRARYASEMHLTRQNSCDPDAKGHSGKARRWSSNSSSSGRQGLPPPEVQHVMHDLLESQDDKNTLWLEEPRVLPKPDESICLEEPDQMLLVSCMASLDEHEL